MAVAKTSFFGSDVSANVSAKAKRASGDARKCFVYQSGREDSNLRPLGPEPSALPG